MPNDSIHLAFNPDTMVVRDMKHAVSCLASIFDTYDRFIAEPGGWSPEQLEHLASRVMQVRDRYTTQRQISGEKK